MMKHKNGLNAFFKPRGCAVVGASRDDKKAGRQVVENMIAAGFLNREGSPQIYLVNPNEEGSLYNIKFYPSLKSIPGTVELVILTVSANRIEEVVADIEARMAVYNDIQAIIVIAAGFAEIGTDEGKKRQKLLVECCRKYGIRIIGPNCVGIIDNINNLDSTFILGTKHKPGGISLISQSGAIGSWLLMDWASQSPEIGFNKFISLGNMADVNIVECLEYLGQDENTKVIGMYMEGYTKVRDLLEVAKEVKKEKPVVVLKVGRTKSGSKAAQSHTGSMAGADSIYDGAFKQYGVLRVDSMEELSDSLRAFDSMPLPQGKRIFVVTQAGGPGIYCIDALGDSSEFEFAKISDNAKKHLKEVLPPFASICHPEGHVDITAAANPVQHREAVETVLSEESVDALILITVPTLFTPAREIGITLKEGILNLRAKGINKPFFPVILSGNAVLEAKMILEEAGIVTFATPDRAVKALKQMIRYSFYRRERVL